MKNNGVTIVMVSHNLDMMRKLCSTLVWLENGNMREIGPSESVARKYMLSAMSDGNHQLIGKSATPARRAGSGEIEITAVRLFNIQGKESDTFQTSGSIVIEMDYLAHEPIPHPNFSLSIFRQDDVFMTGTNNILGGTPIERVTKTGTIRYIVDRIPLLPAMYYLTPAIYNSKTEQVYDYHERSHSFRVVSGGFDEIHGLIKIPARWEWKPA